MTVIPSEVNQVSAFEQYLRISKGRYARFASEDDIGGVIQMLD
jgi:hypothetical protein